ncbi:hypothetical protein E0E54_10135, partial [Azotobacter chroococcum]
MGDGPQVRRSDVAWGPQQRLWRSGRVGGAGHGAWVVFLLFTKPIESIVILRDNTPMKCKRNSDGRAIDHHSLQVMRQQAIK